MKTFEELGVSPEIRRAIEEMGYENPMIEYVYVNMMSCLFEISV